MLSRVLCLLMCLFSSIFASAQAVPHSSHVWIINEENHGHEEIVGNSQMPYYNQLINQYGLAGQFYADQHSSLPALMWYVAGASVTSNNNTVSCDNSQDNIVREVLKKGYTWRSYQEDLPYPGFQGLYSPNDLYYRRHNPLIDFTDACPSTGQDVNSVPLTQMAADFSQRSTVNFAWITPNVNDDAHNGPLKFADDWLQWHIPDILARPEFARGGDGMLFIVWDEADDNDNSCSSTVNQSCGGRTPTLLIGPQVRPDFESTITYHNENVLATVCAAMGFASCPGAGKNASPMSDFFYPSAAAAAAPNDSIQIAAPANGATIIGSLQLQAIASESKTVSQTQVWDNGVKLGAYGTQINATYNLTPGNHTTTVLDLDSTYNIIRQSSVTYRVLPRLAGVQIVSPAVDASVSAPLVHIMAQANESMPVGQMQVWDNGVKLGFYESADVNLYYSFAPGSHTTTIFSYDNSNNILHQSSVKFNVSAPASGVQIASPASGNPLSSPVIQVIAQATEPVAVKQMQVWDNGLKLGWYPGAEIKQQYTLAPGAHTITILDLDDDNRVLHVSAVTLTVPKEASYAHAT